jgi:hypothetical protein
MGCLLHAGASRAQEASYPAFPLDSKRPRITQIQDVRWHFIINDFPRDELDPDDEDEGDAELLRVLYDDQAVRRFLAILLAR